MKNNIFIVMLCILFMSCGGYIPDTGPKDISFNPKSGKVGDVITIIGKNFLTIEDMQLYIDNPEQFKQKHNNYPLIYFNASIVDGSNTSWPEGTKPINYIEFGSDKIVCQVPVGAKTGKIFVNGSYAASMSNLYHLSNEDFTVYDASGDIVR